MVVTTTADTQYLTHQANRVGILMLGDERIFHFVSAAKNTQRLYLGCRAPASLRPILCVASLFHPIDRQVSGLDLEKRPHPAFSVALAISITYCVGYPGLWRYHPATYLPDLIVEPLLT